MQNKNLITNKDWTPEKIASVSKAIAVTVVAGIAIGIFSAAANSYYIAAIIMGIFLTLLIGWQFESALLFYVLIAFIPWGRTPDLAVGGSGYGKGLYVSQIMLGFMFAIWCARYLLQSLPKNRISSAFYIPCGIYLFYTILNIIHTHLFWDPVINKDHQHIHVNIIEFGLRLLSVCAMVMIATTISNAKWLKISTYLFLVPALFNIFNALTGYRIPVQAPWWPLMTYMPICFMTFLILEKNVKPIFRILGIIVTSTSILLIFFKAISWVSGWFGLLVSLGFVVFLKSKKLFAVALVIIAILATINWSYIDSHIIHASNEEGDYDRFALLRGGIKYATKFPLGVGVGNYRTYNSFHYGDLWGTTGYSSAHGTYSQALAEMGFPGLILLLLILISGFRWMYHYYKKAPDGLTKNYLAAALAHTVGISATAFIGDYIFPTYHNGGLVMFSCTVYSWIYWGLAIAHVRINLSEEYEETINSNSKLEYQRALR
ncbi:MAG: O-antigen ligase family protein [Armatimonadota bacterium]